MTKKLTIAVDQDEVLAQFVEKVLRIWNDRNGTKWRPEDINMWHMEKTLGLGSEKFVSDCLLDPDFSLDLGLVPGAQEGFTQLWMDHEVIVVTSVPEHARSHTAKQQWMKRHFPAFDLKNLYFASRKERFDADALIDDGAHNISAWIAKGRPNPIIFNQPGNRNEVFDVPVWRACDWSQVGPIIAAIEQGYGPSDESMLKLGLSQNGRYP